MLLQLKYLFPSSMFLIRITTFTGKTLLKHFYRAFPLVFLSPAFMVHNYALYTTEGLQFSSASCCSTERPKLSSSSSPHSPSLVSLFSFYHFNFHTSSKSSPFNPTLSCAYQYSIYHDHIKYFPGILANKLVYKLHFHFRRILFQSWKTSPFLKHMFKCSLTSLAPFP